MKEATRGPSTNSAAIQAFIDAKYKIFDAYHDALHDTGMVLQMNLKSS